jgi:hypothetical protein
MADALGFLSKMGYSPLGAWGSAYTASAAIMPFLSETLSSKFDLLENESLQGSGGKLPGDQGVETIAGSTEHHLNYNSLDVFIAMVIGGSAGGVLTVVDDSSLAAWTASKFQLLEFDKQVKRHRFWACKANKFTISGEKDKYCKIAIDWFAKNFDPVDTAFPTLAQPANVIVNFDDLVFRIGDQGDALASGDVLGLESFELVFDRAYKADDYQSDATAPKQPLEPVGNDWRVCELTIKVPRFNSANLTGWKDLNTALQADLMFTGPSTYTKQIQLPELRIESGFDANIGGPGILTLDGKLKAYRSSSGNPMYVGNEIRITST